MTVSTVGGTAHVATDADLTRDDTLRTSLTRWSCVMYSQLGLAVMRLVRRNRC